jgi:biofilm PGA synthesis N-glycosyltransferase PgaC
MDSAIAFMQEWGPLILQFQFLYPLFMAYLWMVGGLYYFFQWERRSGLPQDVPENPNPPFVTILVPCFNEGENVIETIASLAAQNYPRFEIVAVNDGSADDTGKLLDAMLARYPQLRVVHLAENQGKAIAMTAGAVAARGEILVCIDGDALLHPNCTAWLVRHFVDQPRLGAVTGNPRVRTRSTLLGKIQVGEFSSIIGLIKRAQRIYGRIFTVSGVVVAFRKAAVHKVGYWSPDMVTEDIDISWKLQMDHWSIIFEPNAICWILMPETLRGLWRQRLRWAQGGVEMFFRYAGDIWRWRKRRMWGVYLEYIASLVWSYSMMGSVFLWGLGQFVALPRALQVQFWPPAYWGMLLGGTCLLQFAVSMWIDSRYEKRLGANYLWMIWYPMAYWVLTTATQVAALPKALLKRRGLRARWKSPDRGLKPAS